MPPPSTPTTGASTSGNPGGSNAIFTGPLITYVGDPSVIGGTFIDRYEPLVGKSDFGMDTLTRLVKGIAPYCLSYAATLVQGAQFSVNSVPYYLQSWEPDNDPVFPGFTLHYKGLVAGLPPPQASGQNIEQNITIAASNVGGYTSATREIQYITRQARTRYVTGSRPTSASYGVDVEVEPVILSSVIRATDSSGAQYVFSGSNAPAALVTALTPTKVVKSFVECSPVVGSPYFECTDTGTRLFQAS